MGFSDILPASFLAGSGPARHPARHARADRGRVRRAGKRANVVIATFRPEVERAQRGDARQRALRAISPWRAGAHGVIGAQPHILRPIARSGRRLVAYSLGNFAFGASSSVTARTGHPAPEALRRGESTVLE